MLDLSSIRQSVLSTPAKGLPPIADGLPVARIPALSLNLLREELSFPLLVIRENALMTNIRSLARAAEDAGVSLAPHGKTTMSPQIFDLQLTAGAWGITLATMHQAAIAAQFGVPRIVLANSVTADADISRLARLHPSPEIIVTSDSVGHARRLATRLTAWGVQTPVPVLVEFGIPNQRSGCRTLDEVKAVLDEIGKHPQALVPAGVLGYEGLLETGNRDEEAGSVQRWLGQFSQAAELAASRKLYKNECIISAGGSAFLDIVLDFMSTFRPAWPHRHVLRSGCAVVHDDGWYAGFAQAVKARGSHHIPLQSALELWAVVQGRPEPDMCILSFGKRDCPYDAGLPVPRLARFQAQPSPESLPEGVSLLPGDIPLVRLSPESYRIDRLYDQHARLRCPEDSPLAVGDLVACGISHPCGAFDRWQWIPTVNESYSVTDMIKTFF